MRWLGWVGLLVLLMACTVQEPVVVERLTATVAVVTEVVTETAVPTFIATPTAVAIVTETDSPASSPTSINVPLVIETDVPATPQPSATPTLPPPATSTPTEFQPLFSHMAFSEQVGGHIQAVTVTDGLAYIGIGPRLVVLDVINPAMPQKIGQSEMLGNIVRDIVLHDEMVYVATGEMGVWQIDVSQPQQPLIVQFIETSQPINRLQANQTHLLAMNRNRNASYSEQAQMIAISLVEGRELGRLTMPGLIVHYALAQDDLHTIIQYGEPPNERAYEFIRWNITNPLHFAQTGDVPLSSFSYNKRVFINGSLAYVIGLGELSIIDISNPNDLVEIFYNPTLMYPMESVQGLVFLPDSQMLIADTACDVDCGAGLQITDGTDITYRSGVGYIAYEMAANETHAFIATGDALVVVSLEQPKSPDIVGHYYETGIVDNITFTNGHFYSIDWTQNFLNIIPLDSLNNSYGHKRVDVIGVPDEIAIEGDLLFLSNHGSYISDDIRVLDISNPSKTEQVATFGGEKPLSVMQTTVSNDVLYTLLNREFTVFDIRNINNAEQIGRYNQTIINHFVLRDNWIYADSAILDISDLTNPQMAGQLPQIVGNVIEMLVVNNRLYLLATADQQPTILYTLDISQPTNPQIIYEQEVDVSITSLTMYNNLLIGLGDDVWAFEINQAEEPVLVDHFVTVGLATGAVVTNGHLYVADGEGGILIFDGVP